MTPSSVTLVNRQLNRRFETPSADCLSAAHGLTRISGKKPF
jgi:hypothetical protein